MFDPAEGHDPVDGSDPTGAPAPAACLIIGIGNLLMGDEGIGVHVVRHLQDRTVPAGVECLDGGTGGFALLGAVAGRRRVLLVDATADGRPPGTVTRLRPRFSRDYPRTLTAHDIGLKDLMDAAYLLEERLDVTLFAVSVAGPFALGTELSPTLAAVVPKVASMVLQELETTE